MAESSMNLPEVGWRLPPGLNARKLGGTFRVLWVTTRPLAFDRTTSLTNPMNENKPVKIGRDGTEIDVSWPTIIFLFYILFYIKVEYFF